MLTSALICPIHCASLFCSLRIDYYWNRSRAKIYEWLRRFPKGFGFLLQNQRWRRLGNTCRGNASGDFIVKFQTLLLPFLKLRLRHREGSVCLNMQKHVQWRFTTWYELWAMQTRAALNECSRLSPDTWDEGQWATTSKGCLCGSERVAGKRYDHIWIATRC